MSRHSQYTPAKFLSKSPLTASYVFNQTATALYVNHPAMPFEFYLDIKLNHVGTAAAYISKFFTNMDLSQIAPLVKSIDMPAFKIETSTLNQYNRKRVSQSKIMFDPIKVVMHDVADGKTLKFWEMYYRYYFSDGNEPGKNTPKESQPSPMSFSSVMQGASAMSSLDPQRINNAIKPTNTNGDKSVVQSIISNTLDNHNFGFNLDTVGNQRNLIQSIDIYQVHGGRFNQVTLVNPRISSFQHDTLQYASDDKPLELTFTIEYEYAYYNIHNMRLGETSETNNSSMNAFTHGATPELPALAFNASLLNFVESNPLTAVQSVQLAALNMQKELNENINGFLSDYVTGPLSESALGGLIKIPEPKINVRFPLPLTKVTQFEAKVGTAIDKKYSDINRSIDKVTKNVKLF